MIFKLSTSKNKTSKHENRTVHTKRLQLSELRKQYIQFILMRHTNTHTAIGRANGKYNFRSFSFCYSTICCVCTTNFTDASILIFGYHRNMLVLLLLLLLLSVLRIVLYLPLLYLVMPFSRL